MWFPSHFGELLNVDEVHAFQLGAARKKGLFGVSPFLEQEFENAAKEADLALDAPALFFSDALSSTAPF
jgi:hypothetical protein